MTCGVTMTMTMIFRRRLTMKIFWWLFVTLFILSPLAGLPFAVFVGLVAIPLAPALAFAVQLGEDKRYGDKK